MKTRSRIHPKVVLLDLKLPKVDGIEVLRKIKADPRTKDMPVVMLTSSQEERDVVETYKLGVNSYIVKPVDFSSFVHAVSELGVVLGIAEQGTVLKAPTFRPSPAASPLLGQEGWPRHQKR